MHEKIVQTNGANSEHKHSKIECFSALNERISRKTTSLSVFSKLRELHQSVTVSIISTRSRLAFNSNGPTTSTCKWNTN